MKITRPALLAFFLCTGVASAQLNGAYTIDFAFTTGGSNYQTFATAAADLLAFGVSGPVTFTVASGNYVGFGIATPVPGANTVDTVTFVAATPLGVVLTGPSAPNLQTIRLGTVATAGSGPAHIVIDGFVVTGAPTGAGIIASGGSNITIRNCSVGNCGSGISLITVNGATIEGNTVSNCANTPGTPGSATYGGGISAYLNSDNILIRSNKVRNCASNGIFVGTSGDTTACDGCVIANNFVSGCPGISSYPGGIVVRRSPYAVVVNNSVRMPASTAFHGIHMQQLSSTTVVHMWPSEVSNNIVRHDGTGACIAMNTNNIAAPQTPDVFDFNLYDPSPSAFMAAIGTGTSATTGYVLLNSLAAWTGLASPNMAGKEANTLLGSSSFVSDDDLHIACTSAALFNGSAAPFASLDIDGDPRSPTNPCRGADEITPGSAFASFSASVLSGPAPLSVTFTDSSCTLSPPISAIAWDFQDDGSTDSTLPNPTFVYTAPGVYSVKLSITDAVGTTSLVKTSYIVVSPYVLTAVTTGGGVGDLLLTGVPAVGSPGVVQGYLFISFLASQPVGTGPFFGLNPDSATFGILYEPAIVGGILHWLSTPGFFPETQFLVPPGGLSFLSGVSVDFVQVDLTGAYSLTNVSNVARAAF